MASLRFLQKIVRELSAAFVKTVGVVSVNGYAALAFAVLAFPAFGQQAEPGDMPPPPRIFSKTERTALDRETDLKGRTKLALDLMETRLAKAEGAHDRNELDAMFTELGAFHGLVDDTLEFLTSKSRGNRKAPANLKRFEIGIRQFAPRLEVIRRDLPAKYEFYVRRLAIYLRDARSQAIEPLFGNTVVPNNQQP